MVVALLFCLMTKPHAPLAPEQLPKRVGEFMDYLRSVAPVKGKKFVPAKPIDPGIVLGFVSSAGMVISDINEPPPKQIPPDRLRRELKTGRGESFRYIVHLAYSIAELPTNSAAQVEKKDGKTRILLLNYNLVFRDENGILKLEEMDYITADGS